MRSIAWRLRAITRRTCLIAAGLAIFSTAAGAAKHPRYGGTLRVELRETAISLDPRAWRPGTVESAASEKIASLVFDHLVSLDNYGRFQPQLAAEWSHDAAAKRWQFRLREGVKFSDDAPLSGAEVMAALKGVLPASIQISASGNVVVMQSNVGMTDLLELLSWGRYFVYHLLPGGNLAGTGPFFVAEAVPAGDGKNARYLLKAREDCWAGRPFVDAIELTLGLPALRRLFDLQLGRADLIEIAPELVRRAAQENIRVWASAPVVTFGLRVDSSQPGASNPRLGEALSHSLDRATMANLLLQKQAEPAATLLPQWLSGYASLFTVDTNLERAKEMRAELPAALASGAEPLRLRIDVPGELAKLLAERIAVNARQAGLSVQVVSRPAQREASAAASGEPAASLHLFAWHVTSLSPRMELNAFLKAMALTEKNAAETGSAEAAQLYEQERRALDQRNVLPIVALPEYAGIGSNVRNWLPARWSEWRLADVWLDVPEARSSAKTSAGAIFASLRQSDPAGGKP